MTNSTPALRLGIDTGGTFTDFVVLRDGEMTVFKIPSTPDSPEQAVLEGLSKILDDGEPFLLQHGSTVATNALLERKGARTLLVTNEGFEDILEIGRQNRPELYSLRASRPSPLVPGRFRIGLRERRDFEGEPLVALEDKSLDWLRNRVAQLKPEAIAVALLYSYQNPESEEKVADRLADLDLPVSLSHRIVPEFREYERTSTTVINAFVTPVMSRYLSSLEHNGLLEKGRLTVMQSNGGTISAEAAAREPVRTLFSGPAGGVVGAFEVARSAGYEQIITFDMGGTSTDVCLVDGRIQTTHEATIDNLPVAVQMIDIHTIGAGGGSIARVDDSGLLRVGPESAGADPGPVCYGKGTDPTVTDCHLLLGRLHPDYFLGGHLHLHPERVPEALRTLASRMSDGEWDAERVAQGVIDICNGQMERALRVISLERGFDTREFTMVTFGGAGGLHACDLARSLLIPRVLVPQNPGALSAQGILRSDIVKDASRTVLLTREAAATELDPIWERLDLAVREQILAEGFEESEIELSRSLDIRYLGQSWEINTPVGGDVAERFHELHERLYGYANRSLDIEIVNARVRGRAAHRDQQLQRHAPQSEDPPADSMIQQTQVMLAGEALSTAFYVRSRLGAGNRITGPAVILEYSSTVVVPEDFEARVDEWLNLILTPID